jgi:hypothetical protein
MIWSSGNITLNCDGLRPTARSKIVVDNIELVERWQDLTALRGDDRWCRRGHKSRSEREDSTKTQSERFIEAARAIGVDESGEEFERAPNAMVSSKAGKKGRSP